MNEHVNPLMQAVLADFQRIFSVDSTPPEAVPEIEDEGPAAEQK